MKNYNKYIVLLAFIILFASITAEAQTLKGVVYGLGAKDNLDPLVKANVVWLGTNIGALTDKAGKFSIKTTNKSNLLVISYMGYEKDTIEVNDFSKLLEIKLKPNLTTKEIKVVGEQPAQVDIIEGAIRTQKVTLKGLQKAACCNLSESFQTNPSVDVSFTNAVTGAKQIQLLGLQGVYIQVLNEQAPAMRGLTANLGLDYIPGPWMESIQISKGLASVTTGFESISGQINIEYKKPDNSEPLFFNAYGNDLGRFEANATSAVKINDKWSEMIFAHASMNQIKIDDNHDSFLDRPLSKQINFMDRWTYKSGSWISQTYLKGLYDEKDGGQTKYWPDRDTNYYGMQIKSRKLEALTKNGYIFDGEDYKSIGTVVSFTHYKVQSFFNKTVYDGEENSVYAKAMFQSQIGDSTNKYVVGGSYSYDNFIELVKIFREPKMESIPGGFLEYTYTGIKDLVLMGGFRADFPNRYKNFYTPRFHASYKIDENTSFRASAGKGYRISNVHAEDIGMFASSRAMYMGPDTIHKEKLKPEEAWNYGINGTTVFNLFDRDFAFNAEFYRTDFQNQTIMDMEQSPTKMFVYNLQGKSYSNSFQADISFEPIYAFVLTAAYRYNDVKMTINHKLVEKPMQSKQKGFLNLAYTTPNNQWLFDFTAEYNGSGRLPNTSTNPEQYRMDENFPAFIMLHAQLTKKFKALELYAGGENLTNFRQRKAIISADDPKGPYFEGSLIWGPVVGRTLYMGLRFYVK